MEVKSAGHGAELDVEGKGRSKISRAGVAIHDSVASWREDQVLGRARGFDPIE